MTNNRLVSASFVAETSFAMLALAALTIATQEAYAVDVGGAGLGAGY